MFEAKRVERAEDVSNIKGTRHHIDDLARLRTAPAPARKINNKSPTTTTTKVLEQMNCAGLFEAVKIRKSGFPNRMPLARFIKNFAPVIPDRARKRAFERHGDNSRSRAKVLAALMTRYMRRDGGGTGTAGPKQYFIGSRLVLMRSEYWTAIHRHRRKAMKSQFVKAINSRDINLLKSAVGRAKELDLGFPEAVTARKLLDFLQLEARIVSDRAPAARACVRLKSFSAAREGILRGLKAALLPVQKVIGFDSPMGYIARGGKWAARLAKAWKVTRACSRRARMMRSDILFFKKSAIFLIFRVVRATGSGRPRRSHQSSHCN